MVHCLKNALTVRLRRVTFLKVKRLIEMTSRLDVLGLPYFINDVRMIRFSKLYLTYDVINSFDLS